MNSNVVFKRFAMASTLALGLMVAGCASSSSARAVDPADPPASSLKTTAKAAVPVPRVQDCGVVSISSPPKYVCNGKVYTSTQLAKLRNDEAKRYQSGK